MEQGSRMKKGWEIKRLGDVCDKASSNVSQNQLANENGQYPIFGAGGFIQNVSFFHRDKDYLSIIKDGAGIGRISILPAYSSVIGTLQYLMPKELLDIRYFYYFLSSIDFGKYKNGSTIPHIYFKDYAQHPILVPPLPEQHRIVSILDESFAAIAKAKENAEKNLANAREVFESTLQRIFVSHNGESVNVKLSDLAIDITDGDHMPPPKSISGIPFVTISNIRKESHQIDFSNTYTVSHEYFQKLKPNRKPKKGDLLYTVTGSYGVPVLISTDREFCFQRHIGLIRPKEEVNSKWLYYWILSPEAILQANETATGTAQKTVSLNALRNFKVPKMTFQHQEYIVAKLDSLSVETQKLASVYKQKLADLEELKKSLLERAFRGELV